MQSRCKCREGWAQSWSRCGRREPSLGADVGRCGRREPSPGADVGRCGRGAPDGRSVCAGARTREDASPTVFLRSVSTHEYPCCLCWAVRHRALVRGGKALTQHRCQICPDTGAHPCHIGTGTGLSPATSAPGLGPTPATSAPGLGLALSHRHRDWAWRSHIGTGTGAHTGPGGHEGVCAASD